MGAVVLRERGPVPMPVPARSPVPSRRWALRAPALAAAGLAGLALVVAAASLSRQGLADFFRHRASDALAQRPLEAIREANRSLRLDAENPRTYYVKAAALARFNQGDAARAVLQQALAKEPDDFVTWTLLGDLAVRQGNLAEAKRNYQRAAALNPRDATIRALAQDPRQALPGATP
jgi:tetratricopeptide (TPR) repeat protein